MCKMLKIIEFIFIYIIVRKIIINKKTKEVLNEVKKLENQKLKKKKYKRSVNIKQNKKMKIDKK